MKILSHKYIVIHHSATPAEWGMQKSIQVINREHGRRLHKSKNGKGYFIAYHYVIGRDGEILNTRPENEAGWHCGNFLVNMRSTAIMLIGDFDKVEPTIEQMGALGRLVEELKTRYSLEDENIAGHRKYKATACPGKNLSDRDIQDVIVKGGRDEVLERMGVSSWALPWWKEGIKRGMISEKSNPKDTPNKEQIVKMILASHKFKPKQNGRKNK